MTDQKSRFVDEYVLHCNKTKAAIAAGYSKTRAKQTGWELCQDPEVAAAIKERLDKRAMSAEEATKRISDNAATRLNDFLIVKKVVETTLVRTPLQKLIDALKLEVTIEAEFFDLGEMTTESEDAHFKAQQIRKDQILRYEIELRHQPKAYRDVPTQRMAERVDVDLVALAHAQDEGAIKKLSFNERGLPSVEMCDAAGAMETILKLNGKLVQKVDHTNNGESFYGFLKLVSTTNE